MLRLDLPRARVDGAPTQVALSSEDGRRRARAVQVGHPDSVGAEVGPVDRSGRRMDRQTAGAALAVEKIGGNTRAIEVCGTDRPSSLVCPIQGAIPARRDG